MKMFLSCDRLGGKKNVKAQDLFQGMEQWENVHICCLLLPVPRIAQTLMADFPKEVCDKCVDLSFMINSVC